MSTKELGHEVALGLININSSLTTPAIWIGVEDEQWPGRMLLHGSDAATIEKSCGEEVSGSQVSLM